MSYNGHQWSGGRDHNPRSHPYQRPNDQSRYQDQHRGHQDRYSSQPRSSWEIGSYDRHDRHSNDYNGHRGHHQQQHYSRGNHLQPHYSSSSSIPSLDHYSASHHDRYNDSYDRRNEFNNNNSNSFSRDTYQRQSMPDLRSDLRPPAGDVRPNNSFQGNSSSGPPMDLQLRTLRVNNGGRDFDKKVTKDILLELFKQVGPVRNIVLKPSFAFVEFEDSDSVAYALAAMDGVQLYGRTLILEPKIQTDPLIFRYLQNLRLYEQQPELFGHHSHE